LYLGKFRKALNNWLGSKRSVYATTVRYTYDARVRLVKVRAEASPLEAG